MTQAVDKDLDTGTETAIATERIPPWVWLALGVLFLLALLVIFVLPKLVEEYELPFTPRAEQEIVVPASGTAAQGIAISPFDEAQRARQRAEAQEVLSGLLLKQEELDGMQVSAWAGESYQQAVDAARVGDEAYRSQRFEEARDLYADADGQLAALLETVPDVFTRLLAEGQAALNEGEAALAEQRFLTALALEPESTEAGLGLNRALTLDQVRALQARAEELQEQGELDAARELLVEATALDPAHEEAARQLAQVRTAIADRQFTQVMSEGFALLQNGDSEQAIAVFERALRLRPGSEQAMEALNQTRNALDIQQINAARELAERAEAEERWADAVAAYEQALQVDGNLVFAQQGRDHAQKRQQLDRLLEEAIAQPERLAEQAVYEQVVGIYYAGRDLGEAGSRLEQQLNTLEGLLRQATRPETVELISDNATEITLYQVGKLGVFERQTLTLDPGNYVAIGTRPGYRDVRREFTVGFGQSPGPITIQCHEMIAANER